MKAVHQISRIPTRIKIDLTPDHTRLLVGVQADVRKRAPRGLGNYHDFNAEVKLVGRKSTKFAASLKPYPEGGAFPVPASGSDYADVNDDGRVDLQLLFDVGLLRDNGAIDETSLVLALQADLTNGGIIFGSDLVNLPPPGQQNRN